MAQQKKKEEVPQSAEQAIELAIAQIDREFGKGSVMRMDGEPTPWPSIPTGSLGIDVALGIKGLPRGRIVEIFGLEGSGKSTVCLQVVANAQSEGGRCLFIDAEHAIDPIYAKALGVNLEEMYLSQPDTGEEAIDVLEKLVRTGGFSVAIVDSVAAMVPKAELEGDMSTQHMGLQPRLMSKAMRKLVGVAAETNTLLIFTNQIREKVGVMYGCLHGETKVPLVDGRTLPIRKIVKDEIEGEVWSLNEETGKLEPKPIIDWHHNGYVELAEDYINIRTEAYDSRSGRFGITVTPDHECMTPDGWKPARSLTIGDSLVSKYQSQFNGTLESFLRGILCSDSYLYRRSNNTAQLVLQNTENPEYMQWKLNKLKPFYGLRQTPGSLTYRTEFSSEWSILKEKYSHRDPLPTLSRLDDISLSIMIMDDGHFEHGHGRYLLSFKRFKGDEEKLCAIEKSFRDAGYEGKVNIKNGLLTLTVESSRRLAQRIHQFVPECMQYKLPEDLRGFYEDYELHAEQREETRSVKIVSIRNASHKQMRHKSKYDISVADNHNYIAGGKGNGVLVHNSPQTTPGGHALRFASSVRIELRRFDKHVSSDGEVVGSKIRAKIIKNKMAPPLKQVEFAITYGVGVDEAHDVATVAYELGVLERAGAWYRFGGENIGNGLDKTVHALEEDSELLERIRQAVYERIRA